MRSGLPALVVLVSVLFAGCAPAREFVPSSVGDDKDAQYYSAYLSARFAASEHDMSDAAKYYRTSLDQNPADPTLLALTFFYETSAGDIEGAAKLATRLVAASPDDRASRLVLAIAALKRRDFKGARTEIAKSPKGPFTSLTVELVDAWAAAGDGDAASVTADIKALHAQPGTDALTNFHEALLLDYLGQTAAADAAYSEAMKNDTPSSRLVDAYGRFLERHGRTADASALYAKLSTSSALLPVLAAGVAGVAF